MRQSEFDPGNSVQTLVKDSLDGPSPSKRFSVVGVGASAGGLEALERLFENMPLETGMAFVVIQHLSPDFRSLTDELLGRRTRIPISTVVDGLRIEPNRIYLLPPRKDMIISSGRLLLSDKDPQQLALPIDNFFRSLANELGELAIGIVLSGTGSDGSRGIRDIRDAGGFVIAQTTESAKFDGMPKSAVQSGAVNLSLPPDEMPLALLQHVEHPEADALRSPSRTEKLPENEMEAIFRMLRDAYDLDFSNYKPDTVTRRTERRIQINRFENLKDYVAKLTDDPDELNRLYKDLLVGVTRFFRDRELFDRLEESVLPELLDAVPADEEIRVWVAGCATGEEVYSLAILLHELSEKRGRKLNARIFATDVHRTSLEFAGVGCYAEEHLSDVSPARLERYFVRKPEGYQIASDLRRYVVFAQHNVFKDAPFTKMDLISCRNLLIYFQPQTQRKSLSLFHFSLKIGGHLVLGPSESPGDLSDEFETLDSRWKVYRKRRDIRLLSDFRASSAGNLSVLRSPLRTPTVAAGATPDLAAVGVYHALLEKFMPPSLLVSDRGEVIHTFAGAGQYLKHGDGRISHDVLDIVAPELRLALSGALPRVFREKSSVSYKALRVSVATGERLVNVAVQPVTIPRQNTMYALVELTESGVVFARTAIPEMDFGQASKEHLETLEDELRYTKENLQATIEELETSNEELQATNEELVASNEELQSTNEELHSVNEELFTVNAEYQKKIAELTELTADIDNLLTSTEVHTIFLDRDLRIRKFTPRISESFNLLPNDVGRRIDSFTHSIDQPDLLSRIEEVLRTGQTYESETRNRRDEWFLLRILPYRSGPIVGGVVLTLIDVSRRKRAEGDARVKESQLRSILRTSPNFVFIKDLDGRYLLTDDSYKRVLGTDPTNKTAYDVYPRELANEIANQDRRVIAEGVPVETEMTLNLADGPRNYLCIRFPLRDESGQITGVSGIKTDVTQLKQIERRMREALDQRDRFLAILSHELRNPLAAILNAARLSKSRPENVRAWIDVIERRAKHTSRLLDDLLDVARVTQSKIEIRKETMDLLATVPDVAEEVESKFIEKNIALEKSLPDSAVVILGDRHRLQQMQVNLLLNAAKYTPPGGRVWYSIEADAERVAIRVRDNGCGIEPHLRDRIFDLFVQADNNSLNRGQGGIGVGLTLVKAIVELHGGHIEVQSPGPGQGSEFIVTLPVTEGLVLDPSASPGPRPVSEARNAVSVLLVEDDPDIRESMCEILEDESYKTFAVADAPTALEAIANGPFQVGVIDIGLPVTSGYELARRIRSHPKGRDMFLVALTGYGRKTDVDEARRAGFNVHLTKPVDIVELLNILDRV